MFDLANLSESKRMVMSVVFVYFPLAIYLMNVAKQENASANLQISALMPSVQQLCEGKWAICGVIALLGPG